MRFSDRTNWHRQPNRLAEGLRLRRESGKPIYDLTVSNPTACGIVYEEQEILAALSSDLSLNYQPDPRGLLSAREAIAYHYRQRGAAVSVDQIILTSSTSEAYGMLFRLLCNTNEAILVPKPSYPLFEHLAELHDVKLRYYLLHYESGWRLDTRSLRDAVDASTRAIVLVHPHNPTGMFLKKHEMNELRRVALEFELPVIFDEVFSDHAFREDPDRFNTGHTIHGVLTFTLNGLSKMAGLPQLKLGWIVIGGEGAVAREALERLEIISDAFLSVNTPVQVALPRILGTAGRTRECILRRVQRNREIMREHLGTETACSVLDSEGGWYSIARFPRIYTDEEWAVRILEVAGVYVFPGYFFDFEEDGLLVASLLPEEQTFEPAIAALADFARSQLR